MSVVPEESRRGRQSPWSSCYNQFCPTWVLGTELTSSVRVVHALTTGLCLQPLSSLKKKLLLLFIICLFVYVCLSAYMWAWVCLFVGGIRFFLPPCEFLRENSDGQAWQQAPLSIKPWLWPNSHIFFFYYWPKTFGVLSTWQKLELSGKKNPQLRKCLHHIEVCGHLLIGMEGLSPLWVVPSLGRRSQAVQESKQS